MRLRERLPGLSDLATFARLFELRTVSRWVGLGLVVGIVAGLGAAAFFVGMEWVSHLVLGEWARFPMQAPAGEESLFGHTAQGPIRWWVVVVAPAVGGLISGLLVWKFAPEAEGHGTDALIEAFHHKGGHVRKRVPFIKTIASIIVIGTGGSAGREGPIAQIGAGFGSFLAGPLKLSDRDRRLLVLAGAAGGIGAIFRTPLGAALFIVEVVYRDDTEVDALVPAVFSSVVAYSVFTLIFGQGNMFAVTGPYTFDPRHLPHFIGMAFGAALVGVVYIKVFYGMRDKVFRPLKIPPWVKPMIGGLAVGLLGLVFMPALGAGYGWLQEALRPETQYLGTGWHAAGMLMGIALLKVLTTSLSISSGGSGGVFGPSAVIGGMVGGAFGYAYTQLAPGLNLDPAHFAIVGMACFLGGVAHAPIATLVMATEMTGSYGLLVPLMLAEGVTYAMMRRFTMYEAQVVSRRDSPAHRSEFILDLLGELKVCDVCTLPSKVETVSPTTPIETLLRRTSDSAQDVFPVVEDGKLVGLTSLEVLRAFFYDEDILALAIAADCAQPLVVLHPTDTLSRALEQFAVSNCPELPVVDEDDEDQLLGLLSYEQVMRAYSAEIRKRGLEMAEAEPA